MACIFTEAAELDIEAIGDYIALDNPQRALTFVHEIRQRCFSAASAPESFSIVSALGESIRRMPFGNYLIFYLVEGSDIVILRVMHGARNITSSDFAELDE